MKLDDPNHLDHSAVLIEAPVHTRFSTAALAGHAVDRARLCLDRGAPAWARVLLRSPHPPADAAELAWLRSQLHGVSVGQSPVPPQHGRLWELDVLPLQGHPLVLLGPVSPPE